VVLALGLEDEARFGDLLRRVPGWRTTEAPRTALLSDAAVAPLRIRRGEVSEVAEPRGEAVELRILDTLLDDATAVRLEDAGIGYLDAGGRAWLAGLPRTGRTQAGKRPRRGMRPEALRMAQLLADHPEEPVSAPELARRGRSTPLTAKRLLARLEGERLMDRGGAGPQLRRHVRDAAALRRWLAREGKPSAVDRLACFFRDPWDVGPAVGDHKLTLTGAGGAQRLGLPVLTGVERAVYRIDADASELEDMPSQLGGIRRDRGANALLIADPGRLADTDERLDAEGRPIAPASRIMLDLYLESRGQAAVELFLDLWGARTDL
jgi:hypothetical protein